MPKNPSSILDDMPRYIKEDALLDKEDAISEYYGRVIDTETSIMDSRASKKLSQAKHDQARAIKRVVGSVQIVLGEMAKVTKETPFASQLIDYYVEQLKSMGFNLDAAAVKTDLGITA